MQKNYIKNYKHVFLKCLAFSTCTLISSSQMFAQETKENIDTSVKQIVDDEMFNISLEVIMNMEITVASKKSEKLSDAPGMITSYSKQDIERYGYYTLKDLANITSGYSTFSTFGETNLETRGQIAGSWNVNKHLLLIDGIPVNHVRANSAPLEYQVPLFGAERVEFLKGPGSALYGSSAFYGVMSVTSKHLKENGTLAEGRFTYGDAGQSKRIMANAAVKTDIGQSNISFSHFKKGFDGDSLGYHNNAFNFNNDNSTYLNASFKFDNTKLKGLGIGMIYTNRYSYAGEHWGTSPISPNNSQNWEEVISYLKYQTKLNKKLNLNSYLKHNISTETGTYGATWNNFWNIYQNLLADSSGAFARVIPISAYSYKTADVEGLAELSYNINETSSLIGGLNFSTRQELATPNSFEWNISIPVDTLTEGTSHQFSYREYNGSIRVNVASAYLQYQKTFPVLNGLILTAGGRFDNGFNKALKPISQLSPRVGLVLKATNKLNFKALYGQALRTPGIREIQGNTAIIEEIKKDAANPEVANNIQNVQSEVIKSIEAGINYNSYFNNGKSSISFAIAGFYNITTKSLDGQQFQYLSKDGKQSTPNIFVNTNGNINAAGFEFDAQYALNENIRFMFNHAFAKANIVKELTDSLQHKTKVSSVFTNVPTQKTNFSTTFILPKRFSATAVVRHIWGYQVAKGDYTDAPNGVLDGYTMLDLNLQAPINEHFGVELQARNLLDTKWKQPSLLGQNSMIPLQRRNFMLTLYTKF